MSEDNHDNKGHQFDFEVDKEKFTSPTPELTVRQILVEYAKEDPASSTLAEREHGDVIELRNLDAIIALKDHKKFVVFHQKPTPVS